MTEIEQLTDLALRFGLNAMALATLVFAFYYPRHGDRTLATTAAIFNIFAFGVLAKLSSVDFSLAAGFGLFAILALFSLRSEQIGRIEISYFFGAISIAVICSIAGTPMLQNIVIIGFVLLGVYVVDHPKLLRGAQAVKVTLDRIEPHLLSDREEMQRVLSERLGVRVKGFEIVSLNYVNDLAVISLTYQKD